MQRYILYWHMHAICRNVDRKPCFPVQKTSVTAPYHIAMDPDLAQDVKNAQRNRIQDNVI